MLLWGECEWPVKSEVNCMISTKNGLEGSNTLGGEDVMTSTKASFGVKIEGIITSVVQEDPRRRLNKEARLLSGERMGRWSTQKFDRRVRMRTLVEVAVNDQRTRILLDTGANVSIVSARYAKKLGLRNIPNQDSNMDIQGISKEKATTTRRPTVKITLGWERVYVFDMWVIDHCAGVDVLLGTDFLMIPAGVRLDMFHSNAKLPDKVSIPLINTQAMKNEPETHYEFSGPSTTLNIPRREWTTFKVSKRRPSPKTHDVRIRRMESVVPTVTSYRKRCPYRVRLTNTTDHTVYYPAHFPILACVPLGHLPRDIGYVRLDSVKYTDWQEQWLATQPSAVARPEYTYPTSILQHEENEAASDNLHEARGDVQRKTTEESDDNWVATTEVRVRTPDKDSSCSDDSSDDSVELNYFQAKTKLNVRGDVTMLENSFISVVKAITTKGYESSEDDVIYVHEPADVELTDYAQELAFLPDFSDHSPTELVFSAANVLNSTLSVDDRAKLVNVLKTHRNIMIASGNVMPYHRRHTE
ncbi:hypothetical protein PHMEG_00024070 [Phytophthora megakarya]|uniref:Peptidase A2 domain-containing protein n=1 Tax=Phytophthora megakarya TaxID=4795 RepID=A0A225VEW9_9STRA|nr:hypothetical protein PHMEG_00024070 [Phytophthora megakarya]